ncbi:hypothetical protein C8F01DRAFT_1190242 [Mycena amicta]|nr:hypothetical protein C8F01DRAFT_1190242 [Mycena amicta]
MPARNFPLVAFFRSQWLLHVASCPFKCSEEGYTTRETHQYAHPFSKPPLSTEDRKSPKGHVPSSRAGKTPIPRPAKIRALAYFARWCQVQTSPACS